MVKSIRVGDSRGEPRIEPGTDSLDSDPSTRDSSSRDELVRVLLGICHAFASASDLRELVSSATRWIREAAGPSTSVSVAVPDRAGRLREAWNSGFPDEPERLKLARRRQVFRERRSVRISLPEPRDWELGMLPLVSRGAAEGVLEVAAPARDLTASWDFLEAIAGQTAIALRNIRRDEQLDQVVDTIESAARLNRDLLDAPTPLDAVRAAVRSIARELQHPVAGWAVTTDPMRLVLADLGAMGSGQRRKLRAAMGEIPRWESIGNARRETLIKRFTSELGIREAIVADAGDGCLITQSLPRPTRKSIDLVRGQLEAALHRLAVAKQAENRVEQLGMGIAWTAHELRAPILGVKTILELQLLEQAATPRNRVMIRKSMRELEQLAETTEGLLEWAAGVRFLRRRNTNVVRIVRSAVDSCELDSSQHRVAIRSPKKIMALIDPLHMRTAIANLVRNALTYSEPSSMVHITVEQHGQAVSVSVTNQGPAISSEEQKAIFDPFVRGTSSSRTSPTGRGLGLFIARRVVEEHGGRIWVDSNRGSDTFRFQVPIDGRGRDVANTDGAIASGDENGLMSEI